MRYVAGFGLLLLLICALGNSRDDQDWQYRWRGPDCIQVTPRTECHGKDIEHLVCSHYVLVLTPACQEIQVFKNR